MVNELKKAIDEQKWSDIQRLAHRNPVKFFNALTSPKLGRHRLEWLHRHIRVLLEIRTSIRDTDFEVLIQQTIGPILNQFKNTTRATEVDE